MSPSLAPLLAPRRSRSAVGTALLGCSLAVVASSTAAASVLVKYPFNNNADGNSGFNYTTFDSSVLAGSVVAAGSGLGVFTVGTDSWSGAMQVLKTGPSTDVAGANAATALANNWYFSVTLTALTTMSIGSIDVDWSRGGTSEQRGWFVRSSLDGFSSDLFTNSTPAGTPTGLQSQAISLSGFTGLSSVEFRFYSWTPETGRYMDFQNLQFNTLTAAIPGPGAAGLAACGLLGLGRRRRR